MTILNEVYSGQNNADIIETFEFTHSALTGGRVSIAKSSFNLNLGIENGGGNREFTGYGVDSIQPSKNTDGTSQLTIAISNINNVLWTQLRQVQQANDQGAQEPVVVTSRIYVSSDVSAPAEAPLIMNLNSVSLTRQTANITAIYAPLYDSYFPRYKYYPSTHNGVKYP
ncbi:unnamed protein product [marine sediment metagenome]|uniref:Uncharacterized protein n=1 Tax=marine sediment metagenome TaxID=412755 RepID=X0WIH0_9ZZZZ